MPAAPASLPPLGQRLDTPAGPTWRWELRRNCCITPRQCLAALGALGGVVAAVALVYTALGYAMVAMFAVFELLALATAVWAYARHACDREVLTLHNGRLAIECECAGQVQRVDLYAPWVRVRCGPEPGALVELEERGRCVEVGRHLQRPHRSRMAQEIRRALVGG